jgi:hypothetical protein
MKKLMLFFGVLVGLLGAPIHLTNAADSGSGSGFTIGIDAPDSEISTYGKYQLQSKDVRKFKVIINNKDNESREFKISVINAGTTSQGKISYTPDADLVNIFQSRMPDLVKPAATSVTVQANSSKEIEFTLTMPKTNFSGDCLGAINVKKVATSGSSGSFGFQNAFAMSIPVHVYSKDQRSVFPKLSLKRSNLKTSGTEAVVQSRLANAAARFFGGITIDSQIVNAAGKKVATTKLTDAEMAPGAAMTHNIPVKTEKMKPGKYTVNTTVSSGKKSYDLTDTFTIKANTVKKVAEDTNQLAPVDNSKWIWIIVSLSALIIMLITALIMVTRKKKGA